MRTLVGSAHERVVNKRVINSPTKCIPGKPDDAMITGKSFLNVPV